MSLLKSFKEGTGSGEERGSTWQRLYVGLNPSLMMERFAKINSIINPWLYASIEIR